MSAIFLSASVPLVGSGDYHETANPFLIQCAVRELTMAVIRQHQIVWGGHPAITPMILAICEDLGVDYFHSVILYQSKFFEDCYPAEIKNFQNVVYTEAISDDLDASLQAMREKMLSRKDLVAAVFIGGMEDVEIEHKLFIQFHSTAMVLPVPSPGGAALNLAKVHGYFAESDLADVDFARFFRTHLAEIINSEGHQSFRKAAELVDADVQFNPGCTYVKETEIPKSDVQAMLYYLQKMPKQEERIAIRSRDNALRNPAQNGHAFHGKLDSDSRANWTVR